MGEPKEKENMEEYDFVVIGGGSAGYAAARTAHENGLKTAVIDGAERLGGLCILRGCMPSKTLIESANRFRSIRRAEEFGLRADSIDVRPKEIVERQRKLINEFAAYRQEQLEDGRFDLIRGTASFSGSHEMKVVPLEGGSEISVKFKTACIATGSKVTRVPIPGLEETGYWTSNEILEAEALPDSLVVLGGGAIALEMACYLEGLGKEVTVIQRSDQLLTGTDSDVAKALEDAIGSRDNLNIITGTSLKEVSLCDDGRKKVTFLHESEEKEVCAHEIVQALGRSPNNTTLNLEAAGIDLAKNGKHIQCNAEQRTSCEHIFAAGDSCGPLEVVHIAIDQGEIAANNAAVLLGKKRNLRSFDNRLKLLGIFTDPQVATVGLSELDAAIEGRKVKVASYPFDDHGKSMVMGETHGFVKLIADVESQEIVGGAVVGPEAVDLIHEIVVAIFYRSKPEEFIKIPHYHPTLSEIWTYPAEDLLF